MALGILNKWLDIVFVSDDYQNPECDSEIVSLVESNFNFTVKTGRRQNIHRGIIMFEFLCRIVCVLQRPWVHSTCVHTIGTVFRQKKKGIRVLEFPNIRKQTMAIKRCGPLGPLKGWGTLANYLLSYFDQFTACNCETILILNVSF
jgi:hypothetical protein